MKKFFIAIISIWCLIFLTSMRNSINSKRLCPVRTEDVIVGIDHTSFFSSIPGVFYVYFGRPTCPSCLEFEPILERTLQKNHWTVYYFDTAFWKDDPQYEHILRKYQVDSIPMLMKLKDGDLEASYMCDLEDEEQTTAALEDFFIPRASGLFSVTSEGRSGMANFPIQFHDRLMALTFLGLASNAAYLLIRWWKRKDSQLLMILVNSTMMILLHALIAGLGFSFSLQYEASPDLSLLGMIGKATWLTITPGLYVLILMLCVGIRFGQGRGKTNDKSDS